MSCTLRDGKLVATGRLHLVGMSCACFLFCSAGSPTVSLSAETFVSELLLLAELLLRLFFLLTGWSSSELSAEAHSSELLLLLLVSL